MSQEYRQDTDVSRESEAPEPAFRHRRRVEGLSERQHREILERLPWYVIGSLSEAERAEIASHLQQCFTCSAELRRERAFARRLVPDDMSATAKRHGVRSLLERIDRADRRRGTARRGRLAGYGLAGLAASIAAFAFLYTIDEAGEPAFTTLSTPAAPAADRIDVILTDPSAGIDELLREFDARLVGGPTGLGRYTIATDPAQSSAVLERLRADSRVRFAARSFAPADPGGDAP